jgi:hypothetical protein
VGCASLRLRTTAPTTPTIPSNSGVTHRQCLRRQGWRRARMESSVFTSFTSFIVVVAACLLDPA